MESSGGSTFVEVSIGRRRKQVLGVASVKDFRGPLDLGLSLVVCYLALGDSGGNVMA